MRFIHASDLHLGMIPDGQKSWGRERSNALLSSLDKIVDLALKENVDALFLLGQSFQSDRASLGFLFVMSSFIPSRISPTIF